MERMGTGSDRMTATPASSRKRGRSPAGSEDDDNSRASKDLTCPICRDRFTAPHETPCNHRFCFKCIERSLERAPVCPVRNCGTYLTLESLKPVTIDDRPDKGSNSRIPDSPQSSGRMGSPKASTFGWPGSSIDAVHGRDGIAAASGDRVRGLLQGDFIQNMTKEELLQLRHGLGEVIKNNALKADNELVLRSLEKFRDARIEELNKLQREVDILKKDVSILSSRTPSRKDVAEDDAFMRKLDKIRNNVGDFEHLWINEAYGPNRQKALDRFSVHVNHFTKYNRLELIASWRHRRRNDTDHSSLSGDTFTQANIVSSIELDKECRRVATAGVLRQIKIFEVDNLKDRSVKMHFPIQEFATKAKLSSLSWNKHISNHLISADYNGVVSLWDADHGEIVREYEEHTNKIWSVDYAKASNIFASGSNDTKVIIWDSLQEASVQTIPSEDSPEQNRAQVCCVKFSPESNSQKVVFGCADSSVHCYDLRYPRAPLFSLRKHDNAVSYVSFINSRQLVTASTDSTLKLWQIEDNSQELVRTFTGHKNQTNFVGLSVHDQFISCGSEDNKVFNYYTGISKPCFSYS
mmetsp:Transcript_27487/g.107587  ORF Transcript_27487/g.107587 Transcript_27487/m.107587 type:complete len:579 (+) Transcript_27487:447-2183(+)